MRVLITGSNGFIGKTLLLALPTRAHKTVATVRAAPDDRNAPSNAIAIGDINAATNWSTALHGADAVVHLAARVHVMRDIVSDPLAEFRRVNTDGTLNLAR